MYRDQFRVLPYGEKGDDWLGLDKRRFLKPTHCISNNQIVGYVLLSEQKNPDLKDQSNREGLFENDAYFDLRDLTLSAISFLEGKRASAKTPPLRTKRRGLFSQLPLKNIKDAVIERHPEDLELKNIIEHEEQYIKEQVEEMREVISRYRRLSTLGQLVQVLLHEGRTPLSKIKTTATNATYKVKQNLEEIPSDLSAYLRKKLDSIISQGSRLGELFDKIEPFSLRQRGRPKKIILEDLLNNVFSLNETSLKSKGIKYKLPSSQTPSTAAPGDFQSIFLNLLENSIYWLEKVPKEDREIIVTFENHRDKELTIIFSDSGPGIINIEPHEIFLPYKTGKHDGIGLGLALVGELLEEYYDGEISLVTNGPLPGATFQLIFRKRI